MAKLTIPTLCSSCHTTPPHLCPSTPSSSVVVRTGKKADLMCLPGMLLINTLIIPRCSHTLCGIIRTMSLWSQHPKTAKDTDWCLAQGPRGPYRMPPKTKMLGLRGTNMPFQTDKPSHTQLLSQQSLRKCLLG